GGVEMQTASLLVEAGCSINGNSGAEGGGILVKQDSNLTLQEVSVCGNKATLSGGGGIYVDTDSRAQVTASTLCSNEAAGEGGGLSTEGQVSLEGSLVVNNTAALEGGGIFAYLAHIVVGNASRVTHNRGLRGGGACVMGQSGELSVVSESIVESNVGAEQGGGLYGGPKCTIIVLDSAVLGNQAATGGGIYIGEEGGVHIGAASHVSNNSAEGTGGGIMADSEAVVDVRDGSRVCFNAATEGGGLYGGDNALLALREVTVCSNMGSQLGGGIALHGVVGGDLTMENVALTLNEAVTGGGASSTGAVIIRAIGCRVEGNLAVDGGGITADEGASVWLEGTVLAGNTASHSGGGVYTSEEGVMVITNSSFQSNSGGLYGGGVHSKGELRMTGSTVERNVAQQGGGLHAESAVHLEECACAANSAKEGGGCITTWAESDIVKCTIGFNVVQDKGGGVLQHTGALRLRQSDVYHNRGELGGGLYAAEETVVLVDEHCSIRHNFASANGGGMVASPSSEMHIRGGSRLEENVAEKEGGGVYLRKGEATLHVTGEARLEGNEALLYFGGAFSTNFGNVVTLQDTEVCGNSAQLYGGAMYLLTTAVQASNVRFVNNTASNGGAIYATLASTLWFTGNSTHPAEMMGNTATDIGGAVALYSGSTMLFGSDNSADQLSTSPSTTPEECLLETELWDVGEYNVVLQDNTAQTLGGALYVLNASVSMRATRVVGNGKQVEGSGAGTGAIMVSFGSLETHNSLVVGSHGTGILVANKSTALVVCCGFLQQTAEHGGALQVDSSGAVVTRSFFLNNSARSEGGAVHTIGGELRVADSTFRGNQAVAGGAMHATLHAHTFLTLTATVFEGNVAEDGAAFHLSTRSVGNGSEFMELSELSFYDNVAAGGGAVLFWDPVDLMRNYTEPPRCRECSPEDVLANNSAGYSSPEGWASPPKFLWGSPEHAEEAGYKYFEQPVNVHLIDMFQSVIVTANSTSVVMRVAENDEDTMSSCSLDVTSFTAASTRMGTAVFDLVMLRGNPGVECELVFEVDSSELYVHLYELVVPLRLCGEGEQLTALQECLECAAGSLSFSNTSGCVSCHQGQESEVQDGIECAGGNKYTVQDGYWVAPNARFCDDDAQCFLNKIYKCDVSAACEAGDGASRHGAGAADVERLQAVLCNQAKFSYGVLCGGTVPPVCSADHYTSSVPECFACPSAALSTTISLATVLLICVLGVAVRYCLLRQSNAGGRQGEKQEVEEAEEGEEEQAVTQATTIMQAKESLKLVVSYMQIISQMSNVLPEDNVPSLFGHLSSQLSFINVDLELMLNLKCLGYHVGYQSSGTFYFKFWQSVCLPWAILLMFYIGFLWLRRRQGLQQKEAFKAGAPARDDVALRRHTDFLLAQKQLRSRCLGSCLFVLMFLHPGVSTTMFQLFNCTELDFSREAVQSWLKVDTSVECFTTEWVFAVVFDVFTMACYVFGYPAFLVYSLRSLRGFTKVRVARADALQHLGLLRTGAWKAHAPQDIVELEKLRNRNIQEPEVPCLDSSSTGSRGNEDESAAATSMTATMDIYMATSTFVECAAAEAEAPPSQVHSAPLPGASEDLRPTRIEVQGGLPFPALVHVKDDFGDEGQVTKRLVTYLDAPANAAVFSQFVDAFEDKYFYWQCYEIVRQMCMTGIIVAVILVLDDLAGCVFAVFASSAAVVLHLKVGPYISDSSDQLQLYLLMSTFITYVTVLVMMASDEADSPLGISLLILNIAVMTAVFVGILPELYEAYQLLHAKAATVARRASLSFSKSERDGSLEHGSSVKSPSETIWTTNLVAAGAAPRLANEDQATALALDGSHKEMWNEPKYALDIDAIISIKVFIAQRPYEALLVARLDRFDLAYDPSKGFLVKETDTK
ncbi:hypothetical protein CYMTET_26173, partial [Cymbomonas tetramitiformis]